MARHFDLRLRFQLAILLAAFLATPLRAQLDPRLQVSAPDFLDLYQQSVNVTMKPEVVTVFDFSGSMAQVMYHPSYPGGGDDNALITMRFTLTPGGKYVTDKYGKSMPAGRYDCTVTLGNLTNGSLVRPDGSLLEFATNGDTAINNNYKNSNPLLGGESNATGYVKASDVRNWIRSASHARFTYNKHTFDLPLCWTILDADTTVDLTNNNVNLRQYRKSYNTSYPLKMTIINPSTANNTEIEMDTAYRVMSDVPQSYGVNSWGSLGIFRMYSSTTPTDGSAPMTDCKFSGANGKNNFVAWGQHYITWIFGGQTVIPQATSAAGKAFANGIPARTRAQAVKDAAMRTWCKYYNKVFWAYRFLKCFSSAAMTPSMDYSDVQQGEGVSTPSNDSANDISTGDPTTTPIFGQSQRGWVLLNDDLASSGTKRSDAGLKRLAAMVDAGYTPLNSALANTYAQLNDPNCAFNAIETGVDKPVECRNSYVILFTDGQPNTDTNQATSVDTPYITSSKGNASKGNTVFATHPTYIDSTSSYYNIINFAALAAHGGDSNNSGLTVPKYPTSTQTFPTAAGSLTSAWIPFWIRGRGAGSEAITFKNPRPITTMTVGVSLSGTTTDTTGSKYRLFAAAACGDPTSTSWDLTTLQPFTLVDPNDPTKGKTDTSANFFDASNPAKLTTSLDAAFSQISLQSNVNAAANPNIPFIGSSFGQEIYLGQFKPPASGGAIWPGDLLMFGLKEVNGSTVITDQGGNTTTKVDATTAIWSAAKALASNRLWSSRNLWTRRPGTTATPEPGLQAFTDTGTGFTDGTTGLTNFVATKSLTSDSASTWTQTDRAHFIQFASGGNTSGTLDANGRPTTNRTQVMGDIIDSAPAALEYNFTDVSGKLTSALSAVSSGNAKHFRLILVGTNQGWLHAFGEVSTMTTDPKTGKDVVVAGAVDELWSFMPTDFLSRLNYVGSASSANAHRFLVDGTPAIYFLDLPKVGASGSGNGVLDYGSDPTTAERAIAVVGLGKGGRSYYALDIHDPFKPALKWSLVPDEYALFPNSRVVAGGPSLSTVQTILQHWGYSTCTPAFGRIQFKGVLRDAVFLGGGYSSSLVEANYPTYPPPSGGNASFPMGRSVLALDVYTGEVLAAVDMNNTSFGPIPAGLIPFEFFLNSGMAQRAYFLDLKGGLWCWGALGKDGNKYRIDDSDLANWTVNGTAGAAPGIRLVAQDKTGKNAIYTTLPAPFRVGSFPGKGFTDTLPTPAAVGIAMVSGDRNNPLDTPIAGVVPTQHRLTMVFDRQDSALWVGDSAGIQDTNLMNLSTPTTDTDARIQPGNDSYYLAPKSGTPQFGYYVPFPAASGGFTPKGITAPMVVSGSLFYSYFVPKSADPCTGGSGETDSNLICDAINPILADSRSVSCTSGNKYVWTGVASGYMALGTRGVIQGGTIPASGTVPAGASQTQMELQTLLGKSQARYPKPRVWRTVR